jgi:predicted Fe-Mo cluster-binding NifX family protein
MTNKKLKTAFPTVIYPDQVLNLMKSEIFIHNIVLIINYEPETVITLIIGSNSYSTFFQKMLVSNTQTT